MLDTKTPLIAEFLKDHQQFSRLLLEIKRLLEKGDLKSARQRAVELDQLAGAHIAYEESELYPRLEKLTNKAVSEELLVDQHDEVLEAVRLLVADGELTPDEVEKAKEAFDVGLTHAEHCGSLISLMGQLQEAEQKESLVVLKRLRDEGKRWTELPKND